MKDYYSILIDGIEKGRTVSRIIRGKSWVGAELSDGSFGIAINTEGESIARERKSLVGLDASEAAQSVLSWNMNEASEAMAVINAYYNSVPRLNALDAKVKYSRRCTEGFDTKGKTVALIGHLRFDNDVLAGAEKVCTIERDPKTGDYPDPACEYILPGCDMVIITGSAAVNKTMPRLLTLSENAVTIVIGPTVPMCPELKKLGIDRLSGMVVTDIEGLTDWMTRERGNPYHFGETFML